jgi:hypothetical protein
MIFTWPVHLMAACWILHTVVRLAGESSRGDFVGNRGNQSDQDNFEFAHPFVPAKTHVSRRVNCALLMTGFNQI